ncbi:MAG: type I methionyl aminopeptidase [Clostridia bacterium]|jgi:methionyl aminopeptidase|nr:type I methionyl aminopeptidase [Clostridia bacterium]
MAIIIKNEDEINKIRVAGKILAEAHKLVADNIQPGVTTSKLDKIVEKYIRSKGAVPSFKGYPSFDGTSKFPASICASINNEVIHGIPNNLKLNDGDILSVDIGVYLNGFHADAARTLKVGKVSEEISRLVDVTQQSFFEGIKHAKPGKHLNEIGAAIQEYVEENGFSVVRDFVGHGVGRDLHEDPQIPHYKQPGRGPVLKKGMVLAIEPMVNEGSFEVEFGDDDWTIVTRDGLCSAHYENTIVITDDEPEILTIISDENE